MTEIKKETDSPQVQTSVYIKPPRDLPAADLRTVIKGTVKPPKTK